MSNDKSFSTDQRVSNESLQPNNDSQLSLATRSHRIQLKTAMTDLADPQTPTETVLSHFAFLKSFSAGQGAFVCFIRSIEILVFSHVFVRFSKIF